MCVPYYRPCLPVGPPAEVWQVFGCCVVAPCIHAVLNVTEPTAGTRGIGLTHFLEGGLRDVVGETGTSEFVEFDTCLGGVVAEWLLPHFRQCVEP